MVSLCLSCVPFYARSEKSELSVGTHLSGSELSSCSLSVLAFWGRFPWWGGFRASRYHGPSKCLLERRGGPWAPPPLLLLILLHVLVFGCYSGIG